MVVNGSGAGDSGDSVKGAAGGRQQHGSQRELQSQPMQQEGDNDRGNRLATSGGGNLSDCSAEGDDYLLFSTINQQNSDYPPPHTKQAATCCGGGSNDSGEEQRTNSKSFANPFSDDGREKVSSERAVASLCKHPVRDVRSSVSGYNSSNSELIGHGNSIARDQYFSYGTSNFTSGSISNSKSDCQVNDSNNYSNDNSYNNELDSSENNDKNSQESCYQKIVGSFACWPTKDNNLQATPNHSSTFNHFDYEQLDEKTRFWRSIKRKYNAFKNQFNSLIRLQQNSNHQQQKQQMAPKRYYILLFCSSLIMIACLLASLAISRSIGGTGDDLTGSGGEDVRSSSSRALKLTGSEVELERRTIDLVDLMECGKTFAYVKIRAQVQVPKSSSVYRQQPNFLHHNNQSPVERQEAQESTQQQVALVTRRRQEVAPIRFVLISAPYITELDSIEATTTDVPDVIGMKPAAATTTTTTLAPASLLSEPIQPVVTFKLNPNAEENREGTPVRDLANIWAQKTGARNRDTSDGNVELDENESNAELMFGSTGSFGAPMASGSTTATGGGGVNGAGYVDYEDPLQLVASDLSLESSSINSTIVDCFIVDTDKRFNQRVALEDRHRLVASTRKVGFKRMMDTITGCRLLTWSSLEKATGGNRMLPLGSATTDPSSLSLSTRSSVPRVPSFLVPNEQVAGGPLTPVDVVKPAEESKVKGGDQQQQHSGANEFLRSIFNSLFEPPHVQPQQQQPKTPQQQQSRVVLPIQPEASDSSPIVTPTMRPRQSFTSRIAQLATGSGYDPTTVTSVAAAPNQQQQQTSYLNMGMSMVSGIVPNTLWCGLGDRASNYSELGAEFRVDACCRAHDHCPIRLRPFTTDYGIINWSMSTRSHCDCDADFNQCLMAVNSTLSNVIRVLYFRFVGLQCIDIENRQQFDQQQPQAATLVG